MLYNKCSGLGIAVRVFLSLVPTYSSSKEVYFICFSWAAFLSWLRYCQCFCLSFGHRGGNKAEQLGRRTWNPVVAGSSPTLTTKLALVLGRQYFNFSFILVCLLLVWLFQCKWHGWELTSFRCSYKCVDHHKQTQPCLKQYIWSYDRKPILKKIWRESLYHWEKQKRSKFVAILPFSDSFRYSVIALEITIFYRGQKYQGSSIYLEIVSH